VEAVVARNVGCVAGARMAAVDAVGTAVRDGMDQVVGAEGTQGVGRAAGLALQLDITGGFGGGEDVGKAPSPPSEPVLTQPEPAMGVGTMSPDCPVKPPPPEPVLVPPREEEATLQWPHMQPPAVPVLVPPVEADRRLEWPLNHPPAQPVLVPPPVEEGCALERPCHPPPVEEPVLVPPAQPLPWVCQGAATPVVNEHMQGAAAKLQPNLEWLHDQPLADPSLAPSMEGYGLEWTRDQLFVKEPVMSLPAELTTADRVAVVKDEGLHRTSRQDPLRDSPALPIWEGQSLMLASVALEDVGGGPTVPEEMQVLALCTEPGVWVDMCSANAHLTDGL